MEWSPWHQTLCPPLFNTELGFKVVEIINVEPCIFAVDLRGALLSTVNDPVDVSIDRHTDKACKVRRHMNRGMVYSSLELMIFLAPCWMMLRSSSLFAVVCYISGESRCSKHWLGKKKISVFAPAEWQVDWGCSFWPLKHTFFNRVLWHCCKFRFIQQTLDVLTLVTVWDGIHTPALSV